MVLFSITDVEVSGDLRNANIYVSVYGKEEERKSTLEGLEKGQRIYQKITGRADFCLSYTGIIFSL